MRKRKVGVFQRPPTCVSSQAIVKVRILLAFEPVPQENSDERKKLSEMSTGAGTTWSKEETLKLIEVWGQEAIQKQLQECKRNQTVYEEVAKEMREAGYERTYQQCRDKIKKLKGDYKKEKDKQGRTGEGRTSWDYFDAMDAVLGHRPATRPPVVIDTSTTSRPVTPVTPGGSEFREGGDDEEEQPVVNEGEAGSLNLSTQSVGSSQSGSRKRKRTSRSDSTMAELMERVISAQRVTRK